MRSRSKRCLVFALVAIVGPLVFASCGGSHGSKAESSAANQAGLVDWPLFGRVPERTHYLPSHERKLDPPLREAWSINTHALIEFPPAVAGGIAYVVNKYGNAKAVRLSDRKILWERDTDPKDSGTPTDVTAPVYHQGKVFFAYVDGSLVAVDAGDGKLIWRTNTSKLPPFGQGGFYSSPAIAFGRVYAARNDGTVFAFDLGTGKVDWSFPTNNFVYGSPAVAKVPGTPPTVYIGSYDEHFYALDARSGKQRWRYEVGGPVPGTATVIGHTVYTSSFKTREAIGIDVRSRRKTFEMHQAGYTPMVSDGRRLYLIGYYELIGLQPTRR
jgi:glucose dehydrogenase